MDKGEAKLQMVQRHLREGEARVHRQRDIVAGMAERSAPTDIALHRLEVFQDALHQHRAPLLRIGAHADADST